MSKTKEENYRIKIHRTVEDVVESLTSSKVMERRQGLDQIEKLFERDDAVNMLETPDAGSATRYRGKTLWLRIFQAVFQAVVQERSAWVKGKHSTLQENKLNQAASRLRWLTQRALRKMNRKVVEALLNHILHSLIHDGQLVTPIAKEYSATLVLVLSYPPHLEHVPAETWGRLVVLCFSEVLNEPFPDALEWPEVGPLPGVRSSEEPEDKGGSTRKRRRGLSPSISTSRFASQKTFSPEQIDFMSVIRILLQWSSAPLLIHVDVSKDGGNVQSNDGDGKPAEPTDPLQTARILLSYFHRFFSDYQVETSSHINAVVGLGVLLTELELNARDLLVQFVATTLPDLLNLWRSTSYARSPTLKEGLLMVLRTLLPFVMLVDQSPWDRSVSIDDMRKSIEDGMTGHRGLKPLPMECLRLAKRDGTGSSAFTGSTFCHGYNFESHHVFTWLTLELQADCAYHCYKASHDISGRDSPRKRPKLEVSDPLLDLLEKGETASSPEARTYCIQTAAFLIDRHWPTLPSDSRKSAHRQLVHLLNIDDAVVQSAAMICLATVISKSSTLPSEEVASLRGLDWLHVWSVASRRIGISGVSRAAAHVMHLLLSESFLEFDTISKDIGRIADELIVQGPTYPYDSVCGFLGRVVTIASRSIRGHQLGLPEKIFGWLADCWTPASLRSSHQLMEPQTTSDILFLLTSICGLEDRPPEHDKILLPDCPLVGWELERQRTEPIRQYFFHSLLPGFKILDNSSPSAAAAPSNDADNVSQTPLNNDQKIPPSMATKCTRFLGKQLEHLIAHWESAIDIRMVQAPQIKQALDVAVLALLFEAILPCNGFRFNNKVGRAAYSLTVRMLQLITTRTWGDQDKALLLISLDPLVRTKHGAGYDLQYEVMVEPGKLSGLRSETLFALERTRKLASKSTSAGADDLRSQLWRHLQSCVEVDDVMVAIRTLLWNFGSDGSAPDAASRDEDDGFVDSAGRSNVSPRSTASGFTSTWFTVVARFLTLPRQILNLVPKSKSKNDVIVDFVFEADKEQRTIKLGSAFCDVIERKDIVLDETELSEAVQWFGVLELHEFALNENVTTFLLRFLSALVTSGHERYPEAEEDIKGLCCWLMKRAKKVGSLSWRLRDCLVFFVEQEILADPSQASLLDSDSMDEDGTAPGVELLRDSTLDPDARVRFRAAYSNARVMSSVCSAGLMSVQDFYMGVFQRYCNQLDRYEYMLTRFLSLANFMIADASNSRVPYWHLIEAGFHVDVYIPHIETVLDGAASRMGLSTRLSLYQAFASNIATAMHRYGLEFMLLPPSLLGFQTRTELILDSFPRLFPMYCFKSHDSISTVFEQQFAKEFLERSGQDEAKALVDVLPDVLALRIAFFIDEMTPSSNVVSVLSTEDNQRLDAAIEAIFKHTASVSSISSELGAIWDRITFSVLRLIDDVDCGKNGPIHLALKTFEGSDIAEVFIRLTRLRGEEYHMHAPNPPAFSAATVIRSLKKLQVLVLSRQSNLVSRGGMIYQTVYALLSAISRTPLLNERFRLLNALCLHIARNHQKISEDYTLLQSVMHAAVLLLDQMDLAPAAESILVWGLERIADSTFPQLHGFQEILAYISRKAMLHAMDKVDEQRRELGVHLLDWIESWMRSCTNGGVKPHICIALESWPRKLPDALQQLLEDMPEIDDVSPRSMAGRGLKDFSSVRQLRAGAPSSSDSDIPFNDFWHLKAKIPAVDLLLDDDVDAFTELLYLHAGRIRAVSDDPQTNRQLARRYTAGGNVAEPKPYLIAVLHEALTTDDIHVVDRAYHSLRSILATGSDLYRLFKPSRPRDSRGAARLQEKAKATDDALHVYLELKVLTSYPIRTRSTTGANLSSLLEDDAAKTCSDFNRWITTTSALMAEILSDRDPFFGQVSIAASSSIPFAEEALPVLTRCILEAELVDGTRSGQDVLTTYFNNVLEAESVDPRCLQSIIMVVIHLRHLLPPRQSGSSQRSDPLAYDHWMDLDFFILARAATTCGLYTTGLLFLELAADGKTGSRKRDHDAAAEDILYTIYGHIDEPDGFYGIKPKDTRNFLIRRLDHESQWDQALQLHGAAFEAGSLSPSIEGNMINALYQVGFDHLALRLFESSTSSSSGSGEMGSVAYRLGWKTGHWDLPPATAETDPDAVLYAIHQTLHRERRMPIVGDLLRGRLRSEVIRMSNIGNEDMAAIRKSVLLLICIADIFKGVQIGKDGFCSEVENGASLDNFEFNNAETILASRMSLLRAWRTQEESKQLGDLDTSETETLTRAEFQCLMELGRLAGINEKAQMALNAIHRAKDLCDDPESVFRIESEFAAALWRQGEQKIAVDHVNALLRSDTIKLDSVKHRTPALASQLGEWVSEAALQKPLDIREKYFDIALKASAEGYTPHEQANILHRYASFCEKQYYADTQSPEATTLANACADLETEKLALEASMLRLSPDSKAFKDCQRQKNKTEHELSQYMVKYTEYIQASADFLCLALEYFARTLALVTTSNDVETVIRLCALWFNNFHDDQLNRRIQQSLVLIPSHKLIFLSHQLSSRLSTEDNHPGQKILQEVVQQLSAQHIFHTFYQLFALTQGSEKRTTRPFVEDNDATEDYRAQAASILTQRLRADDGILGLRVKTLQTACNAYLEWAKHRLPKQNAKSGTGFPIPSSMKIRTLANMKIPIATDTVAPDPTSKYQDIVTILRYDGSFTTAGGINLPKITKCVGSDGITRKQLFKGQGDDDMRQDAVMEQVFDLVNYLLANDRQTKKRHLCVRTYKVVPLAPRAGVLEFVPRTLPLKEWLDHAHLKFRPSDMTDMTAFTRMMETRKKGQDVVTAYAGICRQLRPVMRHFFTEVSKLPIEWFNTRLNYARSVATTSIVGHMIGLGDRHTSNILLQQDTGEVVHIDLGIAFDQGRQLPVPELVPFRLTRDMVDGLGTAGVEGVFRRCAEETLRVLRRDSNVIMTVLGVFKTDPLYSWTVHPLKLRRKQQDTMGTTTTTGTSRRPLFTDTHGTSTTNNDAANGDDDEAPTVDAVAKQAERALASVARKLDKTLSVSHDVQELIAQATDVKNLASIYHGWRPWL